MRDMDDADRGDVLISEEIAESFGVGLVVCCKCSASDPLLNLELLLDVFEDVDEAGDRFCPAATAAAAANC